MCNPEHDPVMRAARATNAAADAYHGHLDKCARCEREPFNQCPEGERLLAAFADAFQRTGGPGSGGAR